MPEIGLFCPPDEAPRIFKDVLSRINLGSFKAVKNNDGYKLLSTNIEIARSFNEREYYLETTEEEVIFASDLRGTIRVWLPFVADDILCMSTISVGRDGNIYHSERRSFYIMRQIRLIFEKDLIKGLQGINIATGAKQFYESIFITRSLVDGLENFKALKPVLCDTFVEFIIPK
jgi:hypothetical protein